MQAKPGCKKGTQQPPSHFLPWHWWLGNRLPEWEGLRSTCTSMSEWWLMAMLFMHDFLAQCCPTPHSLPYQRGGAVSVWHWLFPTILFLLFWSLVLIVSMLKQAHGGHSLHPTRLLSWEEWCWACSPELLRHFQRQQFEPWSSKKKFMKYFHLQGCTVKRHFKRQPLILLTCSAHLQVFGMLREVISLWNFGCMDIHNILTSTKNWFPHKIPSLPKTPALQPLAGWINMQFFLMNHLQNARLGSQVKDPGSNVTGLQKHFVKGKGDSGCTFRKSSSFTRGWRDLLWLLISLCCSADVGNHDYGEHAWKGQEKVIGIWRLPPLGLPLIWTIRDQKAC